MSIHTFNNANEIKEAILDNIHIISKNASDLVDEKFGNEITSMVKKLSESFYILDIIVNKTDQRKVNEIKFTSKILFWQGLNTLTASLQLTRQGYFTEPNILLRHSIENIALIADLFLNPNNYSKFINQQLSGEKCIGRAKKLIPVLGGIYGQLSQIAHPKSPYLATYVTKHDTMLIGGGITNDNLYRVKLNLGFLGFITHIYLEQVELIFYDFISNHTFWIKEKDGSYVKHLSESEKKYGEDAQKMISEALQELENNKKSEVKK